MAHPTLRLRGDGLRTIKLVPGERLTIGRHSTNLLALSDPSVSRFHARVTWDAEARRPGVEDLGSANGTCVDGRHVRGRVTLHDGSALTLGDVTLTIELDENVDAALLTESQESTSGCRLYDEHGSEPRGVVATRAALVDLMLELEAGRRTGTLSLDRAGRHGRLTFARGQVVHVTTDAHSGMAAMREVLETMAGARYVFRVDVEPQESTLWLSVREWLATQETAVGRLRSRWSKSTAA